MAGHHNSDRIVVVGLANGPEGAGTAYLAGDICIRARLAVRNLQQGIPAFLLELGADQVQWEREFL